jgi:hypothetical protein
LGDDRYVGDENVCKEGGIVRVGTHKDYGHGRSELPSRDMPADIDEGTGTTSAQAPTKRLLGHY